MKEQTQHWVNHAEYDLDTAEAMFRTGRYLYVTFMCQQAIEKILKGFIVEWENVYPPYSHNLRRLAEISGVDAQMSDEQLKFLDDLSRWTKLNDNFPAKTQRTQRKPTGKVLLSVSFSCISWISW